MTPDSLRPRLRPACPNFSSGPCAKRPGWSVSVLAGLPAGRSHRAAIGKAKLKAVIDRSRHLLGVPEDYRVGIVPASDTGAVEMALWSLLGARGVDMLAWESFGKTWVGDVITQLRLSDVRVLEAGYGALPDLAAVNFGRDVVFTWNGTTSGVRVPDGEWIADDRQGLTICDATSAVFAMELPWRKLDVVTYSWQKALGSEAAHGMIILSPRAIERLETYTPPRPLPKLFRLTKGGKLLDGIFAGATINTPSMLAVEDVLDALSWAERIGGVAAMIARSETSLAHIQTWIDARDWVENLAQTPETRSCTSVCFTFPGDTPQTVSAIAKRLEAEAVAYDIAGYRDAPPSLRVWCGATVEPDDVAALLPWIEWARYRVLNA